MTIHVQRSLLRLLALLGAISIAPCELQAQFLGLNLRGDVGVKSGSQPGPGIYVIAPLYYRSDYTGIRDENGDEIVSGLNVDVKLFALPAVAMITKAKIAGATYGFQIVPVYLNQRLNLVGSGFVTGAGYGFGDMYVQPINLGWRTKRADFLAGYGFYAPTGAGFRSLDMWAHELIAGTTVYLDNAKNWHVAATGFYDFHQKKSNQDLRVGQILTVEGGAARSFIKGAAHAGLAYVAQWKMTNDSGSDFPAVLPKSKNRAYGLGPEVTMPVFAKGTLVGLVNVRYIWEFGAKTNFEGDTFLVSFTLAKLNVP